MFNKILLKIRQELAPLVEAQLRNELEPVIRANLETEQKEREIAGFNHQIHQTILDSATLMEVLLADIQKANFLLKNSLASVGTPVEAEVESFEGQNSLGAINPELSIRSADSKVAVVPSWTTPDSDRGADVIYDAPCSAAANGNDPLEREKQKLLKAFREGLLLQHVRNYEVRNVREFIAHQLAPKWKEQIRQELREEVIKSKVDRPPKNNPAIEKALSKRLEEIRTSPEVGQLLRQQLREELMPVIRLELEKEMVPAIRAELRTFHSTQIETELRDQFRLPILFSNDGNIDGTVASVLRRNLIECQTDLRSRILDEIWEKVSCAIFSAFGATLEIESEEWDRYVELAKEMMDDRIARQAPGRRRTLQESDGIRIAMSSSVCSISGNAIAVGEFYIVFRGKPYALAPRPEGFVPNVGTNLELWDAEQESNDEIAPPWDGLPWRE